MIALTTTPAGDVRKIVGCMARLRSPYDGEVVAAARAVERLLEPKGVYLEAVADEAFAAVPTSAELDTPWTRELHQYDAEWCLELPIWSAKEADFLKWVAATARFSPAQQAWYDDLYVRRWEAPE